MAEEFFTERKDQSEVKARIVSGYFDAWSKIIAPRTMRSDGKLAYIDLFAGPGRYEDGSASTPLMVLEKALKSVKVRDGLVSIFNDDNENHTNTLRNEIDALPGIKGLKYPPEVYEGQVGRPIADYFERVKLIPTFSFIDPFGYKGLSWALIRSVIKDWGCDCVFFFNYPRVNAGITNPVVDHHMKALFGEVNLEELRLRVAAYLPVSMRESLVLEHLHRALLEAGSKFIQTFRFRNENDTRTTHYLIFVTKHPLGFEVMKGIMAPFSSYSSQGVPSYEYSPSREGASMLFEDARDKLEDELSEEFAGKALTMEAIFHAHNLHKPYIPKNYKEALSNLLAQGRISTNRAPKAGTFADDILVTFPEKPIART